MKFGRKYCLHDNIYKHYDGEVISDKFEIIRTYTNGNYVQKWVTKFYCIICRSSFTMHIEQNFL
jgi:hypothetical protein